MKHLQKIEFAAASFVYGRYVNNIGDILKDVIRKIMVLSRQHQFVDGMQCTDSTGNCKHHQVLKLSKFYAYEFLHFDLCHFIMNR